MDKWNIRKGYLKIHITSVNTKSKKIISVKVTNEHVHDSKVLPKLVDNIALLHNSTIRFFSTGIYNNKTNYKYSIT